MSFSKKIIVLTGVNDNSSGTASIDESAKGVFLSVNALVNDLDFGEYVLCVKWPNGGLMVKLLGLSGKINCKFVLNNADVNNLHIIIINMQDNNLEAFMYGTNSATKLWAANMLDGVKLELGLNPKSVEADTKPQQKQEEFNYTKNTLKVNKVQDFFLDILPQVNNAGKDDNETPIIVSADTEMPLPEYNDAQIASVNFYEPQNAEHLANKQPTFVDMQRQFVLNYGNVVQARTQQKTQEVTVKELAEYSAPHMMQRRYIAELQQRIHHNTDFYSGVSVQSVPTPPKRATNNRTRRGLFSAPRRTLAESAYTTTASELIEDKVQINSAQKNKIKPPSSISAHSIIDTAEKTEKISFYTQVRTQVEQLFNQFPPEKDLMRILPETKWIKVDYDNSGKVYVVGLIGAKPDYICYGVPSKYSKNPPKELDGYCQWLPLDENAPTENGYWLMYQDAITGESVDDI